MWPDATAAVGDIFFFLQQRPPKLQLGIFSEEFSNIETDERNHYDRAQELATPKQYIGL